jgi:hypothetical protein
LVVILLRQSSRANCVLTMVAEQASQWQFLAGIEGASSDIANAADQFAHDAVVAIDCDIVAIPNQAHFAEIGSIASAKDFGGGFACQYRHMNQKTDVRKRKGRWHRKSELLTHEDNSFQPRKSKNYDAQNAGKPPAPSSQVLLDPLAVLTEPLKVPISEGTESSTKSDGVPLQVLPLDELLPDGTCLARALESEVNLPIQISTLPSSGRTQLPNSFRHGSTNPVEPLGLQETSQVPSESGSIYHLEKCRSQCARDVQERYIHELEAQNAFLRTCLMRCFQMAAAGV